MLAVARRRSLVLVLRSALVLAASMLSLAHDALALTIEEARERCREQVGRPIVQSCMHAKGYGPGSGRGPGPESERDVCRTKATPKVKACIERAMNAAHGRANVAVAVPKDKEEPVAPLPADFVPPPRTITDITAVLDAEKPDPTTIQQALAEANATPPPGASARDLVHFYSKRSTARSQLGRLRPALEDAEKALDLARRIGDANLLGRMQQQAGLRYSAMGQPKQALQVFLEQMKTSDVKGARGYLFGAYRRIGGFLIQMGDLTQAEQYLQRSLKLISEARSSGLPGWRQSYADLGQSWESDVELQRAMLAEARGQFADAEKAYGIAEKRRRASIPGILKRPNPPPESQMLQGANLLVLSQARMKARQGRLVEAEIEARRALLAQLKDLGKYNPSTPQFVRAFADILVEQGRLLDAELLARTVLEILKKIGVRGDSQNMAQTLNQLGTILNLQGRFEEASAVFAELDTAIAAWDPQRQQLLALNSARIYAYYTSGKVDAGIAAAEALVKREVARVGETHYVAAGARGILAVGYALADRNADAMREFKIAVPILLAAARENSDDDDAILVAARYRRLQDVVEAYMRLLARIPTPAGEAVADETFRLAEAIRGRAVQQALAAASARAIGGNPELAALVRQAQDLDKQVSAQLGVLNRVLALPSDQREEATVRALRSEIDRLSKARDAAKSDILKRFRDYARLVEPQPPTLEEVRGVLKPGEAFISFYLGQRESFVWAVPKSGAAQFVALPRSAGEIATTIKILRGSLELADPDAPIPPFKAALAYELYEQLLKPVEAAWRGSKSLIVVTNGALGFFPLVLLPTSAPTPVAQASKVPFTDYRNVAWLARTHAVSYVPSASALRTLRQLPPASGKRKKMVGFGDPLFSTEQAAQAESETKTASAETGPGAQRGATRPRRRSVPQLTEDSANIAQLNRLPDTADELKSIAGALGLNPAEVLHLEKDANEKQVKEIDLSTYRVVAFATHGLKAGDLDGLSQPALALTNPAVAGIDGDGLLTMEEVLNLKLDADWVVLSACNTGSGADAGAEAVSGLGRAFFYAGTRTLLVTNWSVDSASARDLVTDLFRRQADNPNLTRAEALQAAIVALMDGPGYIENGVEKYSYAHPLFWAPYTVIGDGGGQGF